MKASCQSVVSKLADTVRNVENAVHGTEEHCQILFSMYKCVTSEERVVFLSTLCRDYGADHANVITLAAQILHLQKKEGDALLCLEDKLRTASTPRYRRLLVQVCKIKDGITFLMKMRSDLLVLLAHPGISQDHSSFRILCSELRELLDIGLSTGELQLVCVKPDTSNDVLQKILSYEVIHSNTSKEPYLRTRFGPYRRCFTFTHSRIPDIPLVILHTALTGYNNVFSDIQSIIDNDLSPSASLTNAHPEDPNHVTVAIFYSVTSTQKGLQGIEFGSYLIPRAVQALRDEFPRIQFFLSLSPIPGFRDWLITELTRYKQQRNSGEWPEFTLLTPDEVAMLSSNHDVAMDTMLGYLKDGNWVTKSDIEAVLRAPLLRMCVKYLYMEKRKGYAANPVANFHLKNGAIIWKLNWMADRSTRGLNASFGLMVNYRYIPDKYLEYSQLYIDKQHIQIADEIAMIVKKLKSLSSQQEAQTKT